MQARELTAEGIGPMSFDEFLAFEQAAEHKHEYVGGYAWPIQFPLGQAGAMRRHNRIAGQFERHLGNAAEGGPCDVFGSDMLLHVGDVGYYPDVQLVCDPTDTDERFTVRPCVLVEVLSDSTKRLDHGEKLAAYQTIPTLRAYLIVSQDTPRVVRHWRDDSGGGAWRQETVTSGSVPIPCLDGFALRLDAIYAKEGA